jgi:hypothetical protein
MSLNDDVRSQADYLKAHAALDKLANDLSITDEQRTAALSARTRLCLDFIGQAQASFDARTAQYQKFIDAMTAAIKELRSGGLADEVKELAGIVDGATALIATVKSAIP